MSDVETPKKPLRILSSDILIADEILPMEYKDAAGHTKKNEELQRLVNEYGYEAGGKYPLTLAQFREFRKVYDEIGKTQPPQIMPGGSSANVLTTVSKLLKDVVVDFIGVSGGKHDKMVRDALTEARVNFIAEKNGHVPEAATSFVILFPPTAKHPDGQRAIATYPGNARDILKSSMIKEEMVKNSDAILVQGSLWQKLDETKSASELGFADKLLDLRWKNSKELWLCMPTQADFSTQDPVHNPHGRTHEEKAKLFRDLIKSANVILGNNEEIARVYTTKEDREDIVRIIERKSLKPTQIKALSNMPINTTAETLEAFGVTEEEFKKYDFRAKTIRSEVALPLLQKELDSGFLEDRSHEKWDKVPGERWHGNTRQMAFITFGPGTPVQVLTPHNDPLSIQPANDPLPGSKTNTLGMGDTSFAGFLAGYIHMQPQGESGPFKTEDLNKLRYSAEIGMALAEEKLKFNGARLPDPKKSLEDEHPDLAHELFSKAHSSWQEYVKPRSPRLVREPKYPVPGNYLG